VGPPPRSRVIHVYCCTTQAEDTSLWNPEGPMNDLAGSGEAAISDAGGGVVQQAQNVIRGMMARECTEYFLGPCFL
jgi:hypothetical protein